MNDKVIRKASAKIWRAKLVRPFSTAKGQHDLLENVLFSIELPGGVRGFGEAAVATHITGETVCGTLGNLKKVAQEIVGRDIGELQNLSEEYKQKFSQNPCTLAALEMALLDALTRIRGIPLWRFWGRKLRILHSDMTVVLGNVFEAEVAVREIFKRGIRSFKVKIGRDFGLDLKRVAIVARLAPRCPIYLDANQGFTAAQTLKFLKELSLLNVQPALIEQPVPKEDWEGLAKVTRESRVPVCADESVRSFADARRLVREKAAGVINIKFMKTGVLEACEIAKFAKKHRIRLMIGTMMESPLATTAAAHLAAGLGGFDFVDLDAPFFMAENVTQGNFATRSGIYDLRKTKKGIGIVPLLS